MAEFFSRSLSDDTIYGIEKMKLKTNTMPAHHAHACYEIFYLLSGERYYFIHDKIYSIKKGDIVLIKPNELHHTIDANKAEYHRILIYFRPEFLNGMEDEIKDLLDYLYSDSNIIRLSISQQPAIEQLLFKLLHEKETAGPHAVLYSKLLLTELLILLNRNFDTSKYIKNELLNQPHKKITDVVQYINNNYNVKLTLEMISQQFFISPYYFCHLFKEVVGLSFIQYLNLVRIKEAQRLLKNTKMNTTQISEAVGYDNISHFGRIFKQTTGISPLKYRKTS